MVASPVQATGVRALLGEPVRAQTGEPVGVVEDLIVDVRSAKVLYVIVDAEERFYTLPVRAFGEGLRLDMDLKNALARQPDADDPKFRRAARLLGQPIEHARGQRIGEIADIEFDAGSGDVARVVVRTDEGLRNMPPTVLAQGRFPPLTRWQVEHPGPEADGNYGYLRREAGADRRRLHDHEFESGAPVQR